MTKSLRIIIIFFICTLIGTVLMWIFDVTGIYKNLLLSDFTRAQYFGFLASDAFAMPLLLFCIIGLNKMRFWAYIATQVEMGTWIYSSIGSFIITILNGSKDWFVLIWTPVYLLISVYIIYYTWTIRDKFH